MSQMRTPEQRRLNAVQRPDAYREVLIDSAGLRIALSVWDGDQAMPAVLFLPGTMTHPLFYEEFLDALNRAGHTIVGVHLAGHGKSPRPRAHRLTFHDLVRCGADAFAWMRREYPDAPAVVLGSSQGGVLALTVAAQPTGAAAVIAHNVLDSALPDTVLGLRSYPLGLLAGMLTADLPGPARCPVVVVAATGDPLFSLAYTRQVFARVDAPSKELIVVDSDEHLLFTDDLDVAVPAILRLLGSLPVPPTANV